MSYSKDLRKRAIKFVIEENNSMRKASKVFDIQYNERLNNLKKQEKYFQNQFVECDTFS